MNTLLLNKDALIEVKLSDKGISEINNKSILGTLHGRYLTTTFYQFSYDFNSLKFKNDWIDRIEVSDSGKEISLNNKCSLKLKYSNAGVYDNESSLKDMFNIVLWQDGEMIDYIKIDADEYIDEQQEVKDGNCSDEFLNLGFDNYQRILKK